MARLAGNVLPAQLSGRSMPLMQLNRVVLPAPLTPSRESNSPCCKVRFTPSKITFSSKLFLMFSADKMSISYAR